MKHICKKIHLWLSIPVGIVFCMMSLTGAILVFESEITQHVYRDLSRIENPGTQPLNKELIKDIVTPTLPDGVEVRYVIESENPCQAYKVLLTNPRGAALYVNQYNGEIIGECNRLEFFATTQSLHRWILDEPVDGKSLGKSITGWCTAASLLILLSGLVLWWPLSRKSLASHFKIKICPATAFWSTIHFTGGFYVLIILLIITLTGLTWSFPAFREGMTAVFGNMPFYHLHTGSFFGLAGKIIWFVTAIIGTILPITGYWLWISRLYHHKH